MSAHSGKKAIVAAFLANMGIAVTKLLAWLLTASSSMLAEAIHSVVDSTNQLLLLLGGKRAAREASPQHPFGYGRERYIYAFIVGIVLFVAGGMFALYEGYHKITHPEPLSQWQWVPVVVLIVAIILESFSFATAIREANKVRGSSSWLRFLVTAKAPELPVVLLEDAAALCGLVFALAGVSATLLTGDGLWDGVATLAIGLLLVLVALVVAREMKSLLIGESAGRDQIRRIEAALVDDESPARVIRGIVHMKTLHLGPEELLIAAKVDIEPGRSVAELAVAIDAAEERVRAAVPIKCVVYLEPGECGSTPPPGQSG
jgi:cation diffusion facilitator family transporter